MTVLPSVAQRLPCGRVRVCTDAHVCAPVRVHVYASTHVFMACACLVCVCAGSRARPPAGARPPVNTSPESMAGGVSGSAAVARVSPARRMWAH